MKRMKSVMVIGACVLAAWGVCGAQVVVSNEYEDLDAKHALTDTPVTFSRMGGRGDFTKGITPRIGGEKLPAQVDVLRKAPDGSMRHALVSFVLPRLPAGGKVRIDWLNEKAADPPAFKWGFDRGGFDLKLVLSLLSRRSAPPSALSSTLSARTEGRLRLEESSRSRDKRVTSDVGRIVARGWTASKRVKVLHDGPIMKEFEVHDVPVDADGKKDPQIDVYWRLRVFTGQGSVRVAAVVERCKDRIKGHKRRVQYKFASVQLLCGGKTLYSTGPYDHVDQTRYRILAWTHGQLEDIHRRPNYDYWQNGRFVPKYRWVKAKSPAEVDTTYGRRTEMRRHPRRGQGILETGIILRHMPNTGGRWDLGPYPSWTAAYLLSGGPKTYRAILHADGNGGGAFFVHVRQNAAPGYNIFTVGQPPLDRGYRIPLYRLPDGSRTPCQPDHAHAPSIGYVSYLLTGDKYYAEELSFWAAYHMGEWPHKGLKWQQMDRSFAWSLRQVVDAAYVLPDGHPLLAYFTKGINKCIDEMTAKLVKSSRRIHSPIAGVFQCSGRQNWVNATRCSPWMYSWVVWALGNAADKGFVKATRVRDWAAEYIIGLYTSDDEFKAPDGKVYRCDPRDAIAYSTAIALVDTKIVTTKDGKKAVKAVGGKPRHIDNYGAVWYYTKLNVDNGWYPNTGLKALPDANNVWPLRKNGFGGGKMFWAYGQKVRPHFNYHLQAMTGLAVAVEAGVPNADKAWRVMMSLGGKQGEYGIQLVPRTKR